MAAPIATETSHPVLSPVASVDVAAPLDLPPVSLGVRPSDNIVMRCLSAVYRSLAAGVEWLFGCFAILTFLAILATVPIVQFISLGYLLESGSRIGRRVGDMHSPECVGLPGWVGHCCVFGCSLSLYVLYLICASLRCC